jgi:hypothetical protein
MTVFTTKFMDLSAAEVMTAPPLKMDPQFGYFPWWPEDGDGWVHPEDVAVARSMIPSDRVFCRDGETGPYVVLHYGDVRLRVRRTLWQKVDAPKFGIGDWVEVLTRGQTNALRIGVIREQLWDDRANEVRYQISEAGQPIEQQYSDADLQRVSPVRS